MKALLTVLVSLCMTSSIYAIEKFNENQLVEDILYDVIDRTIQEADLVVHANTGISLSDVIYDNGKNSKTGVSLSEMINENRENDEQTDPGREGLPENVHDNGAIPDEILRELQQIATERDIEIRLIKDELDRELNQERAEFARENRQYEKPEKLAEERLKLEEKVQKIYDKFERKITKENNLYQEKKESIMARRR